MPAFQKIRRLFTAGKYDRFAALVRGINRALATGSYRSGHTWDLDAEDDALDHAAHPLENARVDRPYFEVLIVEDMTEQRVEDGGQVVSTTYVTPYPPGYPVLVPGQVFSQQILSFMRALDTPEIHGYRPDSSG